MSTRRTSQPQASATKSAYVQPAETTESLLSEIFRGLPWGVAVLRLENPQNVKSFRIIDLNPAAALLTGVKLENLRGRMLSEFPDLLKGPFPDGCREVLESGKPRNLGEISWGGEGILQGVYAVQIFPLPPNYVGVAFEKVAQRKRAEQESRGNEEGLALFIQGIQEYAIFQLDTQGHVVSWNSGAERLKGYRAEEIIGKHFATFHFLGDVKNGKPARLLEEAAKHGQVEDEGWRIRKDGSRFWANVVLTAVRNADGRLQGFTKITRDMTEKREKEESLVRAKQLLEARVTERTADLAKVNEELRIEIEERQNIEEQLRKSLEQLRALAARLQSVREEERTSIAREIHDELGQACTAIKMDLTLIGRKATAKQIHLRAKVGSAMELVDRMIATLRRIASELRPRTLDHLGLTAALEWQAQEFERRTGIPCHVTLPQDPLTLDGDRSTAVFRIFQESLTNVARHAHATRVEARLEIKGNQLIFQVKDNGTGFDPEEARKRKSLGLVGMRERAFLLNGELWIEGIPGTGTTLTLRIPHPPMSYARRASDENLDRR